MRLPLEFNTAISSLSCSSQCSQPQLFSTMPNSWVVQCRRNVTILVAGQKRWGFRLAIRIGEP